MDTKFSKYFGNNIMRKVYVAGIALIAVGLIVAFAYWAGYGIPIAAIGVILFFISSSMQVSDRDIDQKVNSDMESYIKEKIDGRTFGKEILKGSDFSVFSGFIRESNNVRFKSGRDGRMRTSSYFVTAIYAEKGDCKVFTTVYDLLGVEAPVDLFISTTGADRIEFKRDATEFPKGNFKCDLKVERNGKTEELVFFLPDDALVDKLVEKIK